MMKVFVYGTLKKGFRAEHLLSEAKFITKTLIPANKYRMVSLGGFPALIEDPKGPRIEGEVYEVTPATLRRLDYYEGEGSFYRRVVAVTECGEGVHVYVLPKEEINSFPKVEEDSNNVVVWK